MDKSKLNKKYSKIYFATSLLHALYICIFLYSKCTALVVYNAISIIVYICLGCKARNTKHLGYLFIACFWEIMLFCVISSLLVGWNSGFMLYIIGITPLLFYSVYLFRNMNFRYSIKYMVGMLGAFFITMMLCFWGGLQLYTISPAVEHILYTINAISSFVILISFLVVFFAKVKVERIELVEENNALETSAKYDSLTNLLNRRSFNDYMQLYIKLAEDNGNRFGVLMCDIDDFKAINDTYGHECGDLVLINVAQVLKNSLQGSDLVFRWGGEEILILLNGDIKAITQAAEKCRKALESTRIFYKHNQIKITITIGGCMYTDGATKDSMINAADEKMYEGKRNGKNQVVI